MSWLPVRRWIPRREGGEMQTVGRTLHTRGERRCDVRWITRSWCDVWGTGRSTRERPSSLRCFSSSTPALRCGGEAARARSRAPRASARNRRRRGARDGSQRVNAQEAIRAWTLCTVERTVCESIGSKLFWRSRHAIETYAGFVYCLPVLLPAYR